MDTRDDTVDTFNELDELVKFFFSTVDNVKAKTDLQNVMIEADRLADCIMKMDRWIQHLESSRTDIVIPAPWRYQKEDQIDELYKGCDDLIEVFTEIIPRQVAQLVKPYLD